MPIYSSIKRIIVSRPDAIGDVILTLPLCGIIKKHNPQIQIIFLGKTYTQSVINCCEHVDDFINADELLNMPEQQATDKFKSYNADAIIHVFPHKQISKLSSKANIKWRVGTTNRLHHWGTVNRFVALSRKKSDLHESQLNCKLLRGIGIDDVPDLKNMHEYLGFTKIPQGNAALEALLTRDKINVIIHPKSNASAREWGLDKYAELANMIPKIVYRVFISGSEKEKEELRDWLKTLPAEVIDITGKLSLPELISFINKADVLVAASTGPLHIAAACGTKAVGIYPPIKPMHPGRWKPIGKNVIVNYKDIDCNACKNKPHDCACIKSISANSVASSVFYDDLDDDDEEE